MLKRQLLKHNVVDRDRVLIPPNWDSWGKIRVLREGFDVEGVSNEWSLEIQPSPSQQNGNSDPGLNAKASLSSNGDTRLSALNSPGAIATYESMIKNPKGSEALETHSRSLNGLEVEVPTIQEFLATQSESIERLKSEEEQRQDQDIRNATSSLSYGRSYEDGEVMDERSRVNEHIGPVQFNMGGIQVDAEDMLKRLKDREREETPDREAPVPATPGDGKQQNEALANFFAGLIKRGGANSPKP